MINFFEMIQIKDKKKFGFFLIILICFLFSGFYLVKKIRDLREDKNNKNTSNFENDADYKESIDKISEGNFEEASRILEESLKEDSDNSQKLKMLSISQYNEKKYEEAEKNFQKLLKEDDINSPVYYNSLANIYRDQADYNKAIEYYQKSIEANPKYETAYLNLAILYKIELQDLDKYEEIIQQGISELPESEALKKM